MKTYTDREIAERGFDGTQYLRLSDVANALMPVPVGNKKTLLWANEDHDRYVLFQGALCELDGLGEGLDIMGTGRHVVLPDTSIVQPVRLMPLAELVEDRDDE